ncbi:hypothetical protein AAIB41_17775 [Brucella sp. BE17]|uniref:hypothetical protein n=1 Tax=Brucella sp. BE17 TaxID=3142977 RepID=UPI0031BB662A
MTVIDETLTIPSPTTFSKPSVVSRLGREAFDVAINCWYRFLNRRHIERLDALDDYLLSDLGLHRGHLLTARHHRGAENQTQLLRKLAGAQRRTQASGSSADVLCL